MNRFWIAVGALVLTLGALTLAMLLGSASFDFRRYTVHRQRLEKVLREQPSADRLTRGLAEEGTALLAVARTREEVGREASARGGKRTVEIREKGARHAETRVYRAGDMLYFVFFDAAGVMRDFTCVSR
jgi:pilus assembly protein TadC